MRNVIGDNDLLTLLNEKLSRVELLSELLSPVGEFSLRKHKQETVENTVFSEK